MLDKTTALIALDVDGVFNEAYSSELYGLPYDKRLADIEADLYIYFQETFSESLTIDNMLYRVGIMPNSIPELDYYQLQLVLKSAHDTAQFILVSSWVFNSATPMRTVDTMEFIFQKVKPRELPYFAGTTSGGGGKNRELDFMSACEVLGWEGVVLAIDDSGDKHFPKFARNGLLIDVDSANGFTPLNLHESLLIQGKAHTQGRRLRQTKFKILKNEGELVYE